MTRSMWVWLHRWVGLTIAGFLVIVGLTGSLLAFWLEINHWLTPELYPGERPGVTLYVATLVQRAEMIVPKARVGNVYFGYPGTVMIGMEPADGARKLDFEFLHLDPVDGHERGRVTWSGLPRHGVDIMPFVYALHMYLAMADVGQWILGSVALLWTIDCFVAFYLTLPPRVEHGRKDFLARWKTAWMIKFRGSFYRINIDVHRAGGLWLWPILFIFAWSGVSLLFPNVYAGVTRVFFDYASDSHMAYRAQTTEAAAPMGWASAQEVGRKLMAAKAKEKGFKIDRLVALYQLDDKRAYEYRVHSSLDIGEKGGETSVTFDSQTGEPLRFKLLTDAHSGDTMAC